MPYGRLAQWVLEDRERTDQYNQALKIWGDSLAQECVAIADEQAEVTTRQGTTFDPDVPRDKLRIETRLRLAGKIARERYGDATEVKHTGSVSLMAVLASMPRGFELDVTPPSPALASAGPTPQSAEVPVEKIPAKSAVATEDQLI